MASELGGSQITSLMEVLPGIKSVLRNPVADAIVNMIRAGARLGDFRMVDAQELVSYATRRTLITQDEGDQLLAEVTAAEQKRQEKAAERSAKHAAAVEAKAEAKSEKGAAAARAAPKAAKPAKAVKAAPAKPAKAAPKKAAAKPKPAAAKKPARPAAKAKPARKR